MVACRDFGGRGVVSSELVVVRGSGDGVCQGLGWVTFIEVGALRYQGFRLLRLLRLLRLRLRLGLRLGLRLLGLGFANRAASFW